MSVSIFHSNRYIVKTLFATLIATIFPNGSSCDLSYMFLALYKKQFPRKHILSLFEIIANNMLLKFKLMEGIKLII